MAETFDPYHRWLGIPPKEVPPNHYRLLGIELFEERLEVIREAADRRVDYLRKQQTGKHAELAEKLIDEVGMAKACLLNSQQKTTYDALLEYQLQAAARAENSAEGEAPEAEEADRFGKARRAALAVQSYLAAGGRGAGLALFLGVFAASFLLVVALLLWGGRGPAEPQERRASLDLQAGGSAESTAQESETEGVGQRPGDTPTESTAPPTDDVRSPAGGDETPDAQAEPPAAPDMVSPVATESELSQTEVQADSLPAGDQAFGDTPGAGEGPSAPETGQPPGGQPKLAVPSNDDQEAFVRQLDEVFNLDRSRTPQENLELANELLKLSRQSAKSPIERFVLLRTAMERAGAGGDAALMLEVVDAIGDEFDIDAMDVKQKVLTTFGRGASTPEAIRSLVESALALAGEAVAQQQYDAALRVVATASAATRRPAGISYRKSVQDRQEEIEKLSRQHRQVEQALRVLETDPEDGAANLQIGLWYCLHEDDWERGLSHLAKGSDGRLKEVARLELDAPLREPEDQIAMADAWWGLAKTRTGEEKGAFIRHAGTWYEKAREKTTSPPLEAKLERRLEEIAELEQAISSISGSQIGPGQDFANFQWVELSPWIDLDRDSVQGEWRKTGDELTVGAGANARIMLPVTVQGSYDLQLEFTRTKGSDAVAVVLPVGSRGCVVLLSAARGKASRLETIAGKPADKSPFARKPGTLNNDQRYILLVRVRVRGEAAGIEVLLNGRPYLGGFGRQKSLAVSRPWRLPKSNRPGMGANASAVTFHTAKLRTCGGTARLVAPGKT